MTQNRTYVEGRKLTFKQTLAMFENLVQRKATAEERNRLRVRWLFKRQRPRPAKGGKRE